MNFSKIARSLILKMLKNAGKSWKILFNLIIPQPLNFSAFSRALFHECTLFNFLCMFVALFTVNVVVVVAPTAFDVVLVLVLLLLLMLFCCCFSVVAVVALLLL